MNTQHPARQEGLGQPEAPQSSGAEFFKRHGSLVAKEAQMNGQQAAKEQALAAQAADAGYKQGQAETANAMTNKLMSERAAIEAFAQPTMRSQLLGNERGLEGPSIPPEVAAQSEQLAMQLLDGQVNPEAVMQAADQGDLVAAQAIKIAQEMEAQAGQQYAQAQGLDMGAPF